jgi:hypothetical protein
VIVFIVGIDPGPVVGVTRLFLGTVWDGRMLGESGVGQVDPSLLGALLTGLEPYRPTIAIERFVVGSRAGRSATAKAGEEARNVVTYVDEWAARLGFPVFMRSAAEVKPWATDERLKAAGLLDITAGMRHARDAARHALFCAVKTYGLPDPLSRKAGAQ